MWPESRGEAGGASRAKGSARAGLAKGDRILAVDGRQIGDNGEMQDALRQHAVGEDVRLEIERLGGERIELRVPRVA